MKSQQEISKLSILRFLDVINQRIYKVEALEEEAIHLSLTYEQRAKISNVFDMSHKDFFE